MTRMTRYVVLGLCIVAALVCYTAGFSNGATAFLIAGGSFEILAWAFAIYHSDRASD